MDFKPNSLEERIFRLLHTRYPITIEEVQKELKVSAKIIERCLKKMAVRGLIEFDVLTDKTYIRLQVIDRRFAARKLEKEDEKEKKEMSIQGYV